MGPELSLGPTQRLDFEPCSRSHARLVTQIFEEIAPLTRLLGPPRSAADIAAEYVGEPDVPPGGSAAFVVSAVVRVRETGACAGVLQLYRGYPDAGTLWIGGLFLRPGWQGRGRGSEVVDHLGDRARDAGYHSLGAGVGLKNWPALRFWVGRGFTQVKSVVGDREHGPERFADMGLLRRLDGRVPSS